LLAIDPATVNIEDEDNRTPLCTVTEQGSRAMVEVLLEKGVDINTQGGYYGHAF
jgi:ankyrin repeat protein